MTDELFADLPEQYAPTSIVTDTHTLDRCEMCTGVGKVFHWREERLKQLTCRMCKGAGKLIRPIGDRR